MEVIGQNNIVFIEFEILFYVLGILLHQDIAQLIESLKLLNPIK